MGVAVTYDALGSTVATFRSGGRYTYGIIGVGYNHKTENNSLVAEGGFGAHIPVTSWFRINNELKASTIGNDSDEPVLNTGYSLIPSFRIGKHIELFGGVGINYMMTKDVSNSKIFPNHSLWKRLGLPNCNNCISDTSLVYNIYSDSSIQYSLYSISSESTF